MLGFEGVEKGIEWFGALLSFWFGGKTAYGGFEHDASI